MKIPPKKFVQRKMAGKKIRASKQQSTNSLEKKFLQRLGSIHFLAGGVGRRNLGVGQPILTCFTGVGLFIVLV